MSKTLHRLTHGEGRASDADYLVKIADNIPAVGRLRVRRSLLVAGAKFCRKVQDELSAKAPPMRRAARRNCRSAERNNWPPRSLICHVNRVTAESSRRRSKRSR